MTVSKLLCASRSYSSAEMCACSVTAGVRLSWDSRWLWYAAKTATKVKAGPELIANLNLMFMAVFIRGLTGSLTKVIHHVVRGGLPNAVHAGDEVVSGFQLVIRVVTKAEDVSFTPKVKTVVEIVRGVGGVRKRSIIDDHFREGQSVVPVVAS